MIGLLGKKLGMTQVYDAKGRRRVVTAVLVGPCTIVGLRSAKKEGYAAIQVGFERLEESDVTKPVAGQFKKRGVGVFRHVRELRLDQPGAMAGLDMTVDALKDPKNAKTEEESPVGSSDKTKDAEKDAATSGFTLGQELTVDIFKDYELVDVTATSIGKGFQGGMKRWNWKGGPKSHGSNFHRAPGSIGTSATPGHVLKGHHLPGHMGDDRVTVQNVRIIRRDAEKHLLLLEGAIPGHEDTLIVIKKAMKKPGVVKSLSPVRVESDEDQDNAKSETKKSKVKASAKAKK